jgi:hypothetical protein
MAEADFKSFQCRLENSKVITGLLLCLCPPINSRRDNICQIEANSEALIFMFTGKSKSTQSRAQFKTAIFDNYEVKSGTLPEPIM